MEWALDTILFADGASIIMGVRRFGSENKFGEFVTRQGTPLFVIKRLGGGQLTFSRLWIVHLVRVESNVTLETP